MFQIALRNLLRSRLRTLFTLFGIAVSLSVYMTLASVSLGYRGQLDQTIGLAGVDAVIQTKNVSSMTSSRLTQSDLAALKSIGEIGELTPLIVGSMRSRSASYSILVGLPETGGMEMAARRLGLGLVHGRLHSPGKKEAIIGERAAKKFKLEVGSKFQAESGEELDIVGVYRMGIEVLDGALVTDMSCARALLGRPDGEFGIALAKAKAGVPVVEMVAAVNNSNPRLWAVAGDGLAARIRSLSFIDSFIRIVTVLSFLMSGLLLANTLLMALAERTREIGILMVIGWSRSRVVGLIIIEGLLLCTVGSLAAYALSWAVLPLLEAIPALGAGWLPAGPPLALLPKSVALAALTGVASSLFPALYSTRLDPVDALQSE